MHAIESLNEVKFADGSTKHTNNITPPIQLSIQNNRSEESFIVLPLANYDAIIGMPYLKKFNPTIDWSNHNIMFDDTNRVHASKQQKQHKTNQSTNQQCYSKSLRNTVTTSSSLQANNSCKSSIAKTEISNRQRELQNSLHQNILNQAMLRQSHTSQIYNFTTRNPIAHLCSIISRKELKQAKKSEQLMLVLVKPEDSQGEAKSPTSNLQINHINTNNSQQLPNENENALQSVRARVLQKYKDVFPDDLPKELPPRRHIEHSIDLIPGSSPPSKQPYKMSPKELDELKKIIDDLLAHGFIQPAASPFGAPVLFVKKKDGTMRMCVDYRALNKITIANKYPLPRIDELFDRLQGAKYFSKIDLRSGYHQVRIAEKDIDKTTFNSRYGSYSFKVLSFGLCNAPATFMNLMNSILHEYLDKFAIVFLDDIMIYSKTLAEHEQHLEQVLSKLRQHKLYGKLSKTELVQQKIGFLGHMVTPEGLCVDPDKLKAVSEWPVCKTVHDVRSFLGFVGYYRKFIKSFSAIVAPLSDLTKTANNKDPLLNKQVKWGREEKQAFQTIKEKVCNAPVLALPNTDLPFVLTTDASGFAIGATLSQDQGNGLQPIAFMSKKMLDAETRYPTHEQELLAIVCALKQWRHYLHGSKFEVIAETDHKPLTYLQSQPHLSKRQVGWLDVLAEFGCTPGLKVVYRQGKYNIAADALSRRSDHKEDEQHGTPETTQLKTTSKDFKMDLKLDTSSVQQLFKSNFEPQDLKTCNINCPNNGSDPTSVQGSEGYGNCPVRTLATDKTENEQQSSASNQALKPEASFSNVQTYIHNNTDDKNPRNHNNNHNQKRQTSNQLLNNVGLDKQQQSVQDNQTVTDNSISDLQKNAHTSSLYDLQSLLKTAYTRDKTCSAVLTEMLQTKSNKYKKFTLNSESILLKNNRIYVPDDMSVKTLILQEAHDNKLAGGHSGIHRTKLKIARHYTWNKLQQDVEDYVNSCIQCQTSKSSTQKPQGLLQSIGAADKRWQTISMDFIGPLKASGNGFTCILVVVDTLSKYAHFIPTHITATAPQIAQLVFNNVVRYHGVPESIISDRDARFTSAFWEALWSMCGTKLRRSTAYRPQTDGQTERTNKTLEEYLRSYIGNNMDDWDTLLMYAEIAHNNNVSVSTGYTPYFLNRGEEINLPITQIAQALNKEDNIHNKNETALQLVSSLQQHLSTAKQRIEQAQQKQKHYADQKRTDIQYNIGDQVMLNAKDINMSFFYKDLTMKLRSKYLGPFTIIRKLSPLNYELQLPTPLKRLHPVFHISKLKKYDANKATRFSTGIIVRQQNVRPISIDTNAAGEPMWEVEQIVDKRTRTIRGRRCTEYLVKWKDYPAYENSWEPIRNLQQAKDVIHRYEHTRGRTGAR